MRLPSAIALRALRLLLAAAGLMAPAASAWAQDEDDDAEAAPATDEADESTDDSAEAAPEAKADEPLADDDVAIVLEATPAERQYHDADSIWPKACKSLATALQPGTGPWGLGLFSKHACATLGKGRVSTKPWTLTVTLGKKQTKVALHRTGGAAATETSFRAAWPIDMLADPAFARIVAATLLDDLPVLARLDAPGAPILKADSGTIETAPPSDGDAKGKSWLPPPPKNLSLYSLAWSPRLGIWRPKALGTAQLVRADDDEIVWKVSGDAAKAGKRAKAAAIYAHDAGGRGQLGKTLQKKLTLAAKQLAKRIDADKSEISLANAGAIFRRGVSSGYVGLRYGHSFFQGPVIQDLSFIGVLVELRGAPLDGLRFYYDLWPEVTTDEPTGASSFSGQRVVLGWSFGFKPPILLDRIDVVPKLGMWSTRTRFRVEKEDQSIEEVAFDVNRALGLGLELGAEIDASWALARAWVASDLGFNPIKGQGDDTRVTTSRYGGDLWIHGPDFSLFGRPGNLSLLGFGLYESVSLSKKKDDSDATEAVTIDRIQYDVGYLGVGFALSW